MIVFAIENKSVKERIRKSDTLEVPLHVPQPEIYMIKPNYQIINYKSFPSQGTIGVLLLLYLPLLQHLEYEHRRQELSHSLVMIMETPQE